MHGNLCTASGFAHNAFRFDDAVCHLGHFCFKKFYKKARVRASEADECTTNAFINAEEKCTHALALAVALARNLFVVGKDCGCTSEVHVKIAALKTLYVASHYFAFTLAIFRND